MRTSALDVLRLAYWLLRNREDRKHMRIGQCLENYREIAGNNCGVPMFYIENDDLIEATRYGGNIPERTTERGAAP